MVKNNKRKRNASPASSMVTPARSAITTTTNRHSHKVTGKILVEAYKHLVVSNKNLQDQWFSAADLCSIFPSYCTSLKGIKETNKWPSMFTRSINQIAQIVYNDKSESGIYSNRYGRDEQMYYLYTKEDKCPENKQPKDDVFPISNI